MLDNYFTLQALVREWRPLVVGSRLGAITTGDKNALELVLESHDGSSRVMRLSFRAKNRFTVLGQASPNAKKQKRNRRTLFESSRGQTVVDVKIAERDRIVYLDLSGGRELAIYLYGSQPNLFLVDSQRVLESYKKSEEWVGKAPPSPRMAREQDPDMDESLAVRDRAKKLFGSLPAILLDELIDRSDGTTSSLQKEGLEMTSALAAASRAYVYWQDGRPSVLSLTPLAAFGHLEVEEFESINKACAIVGGTRLKRSSFDELYLPLEKKLKSALAKKQKMLESLSKAMEAESRADRYQHWGDLLMSQMEITNPKRLSEIELADFTNSESKNIIALKPELSFVENAKIYYEKAKRARSKRGHDLSRIPNLKKEVFELEQKVGDLETIVDEKSLKRFLSNESSILEDLTGLGFERKKGEAVSRFKRFEISGGYTVLVGKNAKQNDELTLKGSGKEDIWMHARGYPGSHTVLKTSGRNDQPPKSVIEEAASIAAFYSKGKSSSLVPVQYTRRKNVSKPKGAARGSVRLTKEQVVLVEPRLPS